MKVFLGWSGGRSKQTAEALGDWLGQVIQAVDPWISSDILKGARWEEEISDKLEEAKIGIICLTKENLDENWILFEAGALSKTKDAHVCTFLLDLKPTDIKQPLALFQHTEFEKEDIRKLAHTINQAVEGAGERSLDAPRLDKIFNRFWPDLEEKLKEIAAMHSEVSKPIRTDREILEEILNIVRKPGQTPLEILNMGNEIREHLSRVNFLIRELDDMGYNRRGELGKDDIKELAAIRNSLEEMRNRAYSTRGDFMNDKKMTKDLENRMELISCRLDLGE
jgi:hypothetical protein